MFNVETKKNGNEVEVVIEGMIDSTTSDEFASSMEKVLLDCPALLTLNFKKVDYVSSAGFRVLFMVAKEMKKNEGKLRATCVSEEIKNLFSMVHMEHVMEIES